MLVRVDVRSSEQQAVGGELCVGGPHLLAAQPPAAVILPARAGLDGRQIRSGGGLGEQLAPDLIAVEHRSEVARLLLVGAVGDDRRAEHADADDVEDSGHFYTSDLLVADHLLDRTEPLSAVLLWPGHAREAALGELALPGAPRGEDLRLVLQCPGAGEDRRLGGVLCEPAPHPGAVGGLLWCVVEIHGCILLWLTDQSIAWGERYSLARGDVAREGARGTHLQRHDWVTIGATCPAREVLLREMLFAREVLFSLKTRYNYSYTHTHFLFRRPPGSAAGERAAGGRRRRTRG